MPNRSTTSYIADSSPNCSTDILCLKTRFLPLFSILFAIFLTSLRNSGYRLMPFNFFEKFMTARLNVNLTKSLDNFFFYYKIAFVYLRNYANAAIFIIVWRVWFYDSWFDI